MKRRNREVSIFSMSALDLFASALGAFILIAIVMFPHFPYTGTADQRDLDAARQAASDAQAAAAAAQQHAQDLQRQLDELELPHLDLVIVLDVTGSMRGQIEGLKDEIDALPTILLRLASSVAVGVVAFGDREWPQPVTQFRLADVGAGGNRTRLAGFINSLSTNMGMGGGNPDLPEAVLEAVRAAVDMPWRSQAERRQVVVITDNPAYPEEVEATVAAAASFAAGGRGGSVSTVFVNTGRTSSEGTEAFLRRVASAGDGLAVRAGGSMTANLLLALL